MDDLKKREFVSRMGKKRLKLSKGGLIKKVAGRVYFDDGGGVAANTSIPQSQVNWSAADAYNPLQLDSEVVGGLAKGVGGFATGLASDFTSQSGYQAQLAPTTQLNYAPVVGGAGSGALGGYGTSQNILAQQQMLANQLAAEGRGAGPNPALNQLNQTTGQNVANQAAMMAGQRGAAANVGLLARESAQQGAATQQQAVGQAATMSAQQQIAYQQALQQQQSNMATQNIAEQNANTSLFGNAAAANNAQNNTSVSNYGMAQGLNQDTASKNAGAVNSTLSGLMGGGSSALSSMFAEGGEVGDTTAPIVPEPTAPQIPAVMDKYQGPPDTSKKDDKGGGGGGGLGAIAMLALAKGGNICEGPHKSHVANFLLMAKGGKVPAMVSPGEVYLSPDKVHQVINEGANPMKIGEKIPGKAKVRGDSLKNDIVPRTLEEGGIVIPRHIAAHKMAPEKAELFVHRAMARKGRK